MRSMPSRGCARLCSLEEWRVVINDQAALIADPDGRREWLNAYVDRLRGLVVHDELVEMYELIDAARWWALDERVTLGIGD